MVFSFWLSGERREKNDNVKCNVTLITQWFPPSPSLPSCRAVTPASAPSWRWLQTGWAAKPKKRASAADTRSCSGTKTSPCESLRTCMLAHSHGRRQFFRQFCRLDDKKSSIFCCDCFVSFNGWRQKVQNLGVLTRIKWLFKYFPDVVKAVGKHTCVNKQHSTVECSSSNVSFFVPGSNVTPQSRLDLKLWSCHTLRKELLGCATIDLLDTLRTHDGKSKHLARRSPQSKKRSNFVLTGGSGSLSLNGIHIWSDLSFEKILKGNQVGHVNVASVGRPILTNGM